MNHGAEVAENWKAPLLQALKSVLQFEKVVVGEVVEKEERATLVPLVPNEAVEFPRAYWADEERK